MRKKLNDNGSTFTKFYTSFYGCEEFDSVLQATIYAYVYMYTLRSKCKRCNVSYLTLMNKFYISKMTAIRVMKELEGKGLIESTPHGRKTKKGWIKGYWALKDPSEFTRKIIYEAEDDYSEEVENQAWYE